MTRRNAIDFWNGPEGAVIRWRCNCGHEGFLDHTGSYADATGPAQQDRHERTTPGPAAVRAQEPAQR